MVDPIDRKLLDLLQRDARLSNAELAEKVGLTVSSVHERVKKMERKGIITGYVATVDAEKLGKGLLAFMRLTFGETETEPLPSVKSKLSELCADEPDILECHNVAGEDCYVIKIRSEGPKELEATMNRIRACARVSRSVTSIVLSTDKESIRILPNDPLTEAERVLTQLPALGGMP